jgi:hypothetical protein
VSAVFENRGLSQASAMLGGGLSLLCAIHCALVPLLFLITPTFKLALYSVRDPNHKIAIWMLASLRYERWMVWLGIIFAALALFSNARASKRSTQFFFLGAGLSLVGVYSPAPAAFLHSGLMILGGLVLFYAVLLNARSCRS